jgi:hypothetical protein
MNAGAAAPLINNSGFTLPACFLMNFHLSEINTKLGLVSNGIVAAKHRLSLKVFNF